MPHGHWGAQGGILCHLVGAYHGIDIHTLLSSLHPSVPLRLAAFYPLPVVCSLR